MYYAYVCDVRYTMWVANGSMRWRSRNLNAKNIAARRKKWNENEREKNTSLITFLALKQFSLFLLPPFFGNLTTYTFSHLIVSVWIWYEVLTTIQSNNFHYVNIHVASNGCCQGRFTFQIRSTLKLSKFVSI